AGKDRFVMNDALARSGCRYLHVVWSVDLAQTCDRVVPDLVAVGKLAQYGRRVDERRRVGAGIIISGRKHAATGAEIDEQDVGDSAGLGLSGSNDNIRATRSLVCGLALRGA